MSGELDEATMGSVRRLQCEHDVDVGVLMADTFEARKNWIQRHSPPVPAVLTLFPPLKDVLSSHVSSLFSKLAAYFFAGKFGLGIAVTTARNCQVK